MIEQLVEPFTYVFMQRAFIGMLLIGLCAGLLSPFIILRRLSLVGDGLAHLAFGGVALAFLLQTPVLLTSFIVVLVGSLFLRKLLSKNLFGEAAISLVLSFGVGLGILIIGATNGFGVDLFSYLIGSILALQPLSLFILSLLALIILSMLWFFRRELLLLTFEGDIAHLVSRKTKIADIIFILLIAVVTFMSIRAVGILLVSALLVIPGLISFVWAKSFWHSVFVSAFISVLVGVVGIYTSFALDLPPSGLIVVLLLACYGFSVFVQKRT